MQNNLRKRLSLLSLLLVLSLLLGCVFLFSSCSFNLARSVTGAKISAGGELVLSYSDGSSESLGLVRSEGGETNVDYTVTVNGTGEDSAAAAAAGLLSAVSIQANFEKTTVSFPFYTPTTSSYASKGSGVIYSLDKEQGNAVIVTNYHVVFDAESNTETGVSDDISVYLYGAEYDAKAIPATYLGGSLYYDVAVLCVKDSDLIRTAPLQAATFADSDKTCAGDTAIAVGNAAGLGISVTRGIVSVDSEYITMKAADEKTTVTFRVMRIDTAINSGNSGGGLYSRNGELIGIVNAKMSVSGIENIAYAIPSRIVKGVAENILKNSGIAAGPQTVQRVVLGATLGTVNSAAAIDEETGLVRVRETVAISDVTKGSLADGVLQEGDILQSATLAGETVTITRRFQLLDLLLHAGEGDSLTLTFSRDGVSRTVTFTFPKGNAVSY